MEITEILENETFLLFVTGFVFLFIIFMYQKIFGKKQAIKYDLPGQKSLREEVLKDKE